jgi:chromosomal replication initiation ATPase DnaA
MLDKLLREICDRMGVNVKIVKAKGRSPLIVLTRQLFFYYAQVYTDSFLSEIAATAGQCTHANVLHGRNKIAAIVDDGSIHNAKNKEILDFKRQMDKDIEDILANGTLSLEKLEKRISILEQKLKDLL